MRLELNLQEYNNEIKIRELLYLTKSNQSMQSHRLIKQSMVISKSSRRKTLPKQHCVDDLACQHCCMCWVKFKKQYDIKITILTNKYEKAAQQIQFLTSLNKELKKMLDVSRKKQRNDNDLEEFRETLQKQLNEKRAVEDAITKQKIQQLQKNNLQQAAQLQQLKAERQDHIARIHSLQTEIQTQKNINQENKQQISRLKEENEEFYQRNQQLYNQISKLEKNLDDKTNLITRMSKSIQELQKIYINQKNKSNYQTADNQMLKTNLRNKDKCIDQLTKCTQITYKQMGSLEFKNKELRSLVGTLDYEVIAGRANQEYLKSRLIDTEERLVMTEGFARYNKQKVELMKNDLNLLKLQI